MRKEERGKRQGNNFPQEEIQIYDTTSLSKIGEISIPKSPEGSKPRPEFQAGYPGSEPPPESPEVPESDFFFACSNGFKVLVIIGSEFFITCGRDLKILSSGFAPRRESFVRCWCFGQYLP
jgi:hypothetical protein